MIKKRKKPKSPALNCDQISLQQNLAKLTSFCKELRKTGEIQGNNTRFDLCTSMHWKKGGKEVFTQQQRQTDTKSKIQRNTLKYKENN